MNSNKENINPNSVFNNPLEASQLVKHLNSQIDELEGAMQELQRKNHNLQNQVSYYKRIATSEKAVKKTTKDSKLKSALNYRDMAPSTKDKLHAAVRKQVVGSVSSLEQDDVFTSFLVDAISKGGEKKILSKVEQVMKNKTIKAILQRIAKANLVLASFK